ncbi:MAG: DUF4173 domain-containing protein [Bacteroidota bacterium]
MKFNRTVLVVFLGAFLLTALFYKQYFGLNVLFFDVLFILWLIGSKQWSWKQPNEIIASCGFILTALFTVLTHSTFSYFMHFLAISVYIGVLNYPKVRSLVNAAMISIVALFQSQGVFGNLLSGTRMKGKTVGGLLWKARIFIIPVFIICLFLGLYSFSNPVFGDMVNHLGLGIQNTFNFIFEGLDFFLLLTFLLCLFISIYLFTRTANKDLVLQDTNAVEVLQRDKKKYPRWFKLTGLKNEYKAGVFLLLILNVLLLILNMLDVYWVWFNFAWEGQTLKPFVHEGTYLLIFSILISIAVVLYFFRGNLNFYAKNRFLKYLSYIWIIQNGILVISVGIRNFRYIEYFSLAYKRIGVIIFLALVLYGLYSVVRKIQLKKSAFYLFKSNALVLYAVLVLVSFINWDGFIAKYNFAHAHTSYLHLDYMSSLSDKSLPHLDKPLAELVQINTIQNEKYQFEYTMQPEEYQRIIHNRKLNFKKKWESKNILSWNLPEYLAYKKLFKN